MSNNWIKLLFVHFYYKPHYVRFIKKNQIKSVISYKVYKVVIHLNFSVAFKFARPVMT